MWVESHLVKSQAGGHHFNAPAVREKDTLQLTVWVSQPCYVKHLQLKVQDSDVWRRTDTVERQFVQEIVLDTVCKRTVVKQGLTYMFDMHDHGKKWRVFISCEHAERVSGSQGHWVQSLCDKIEGKNDEEEMLFWQDGTPQDQLVVSEQ